MAKKRKPDLQKLTREFHRLRDQKYSEHGNVEARVLEAICAVNGDHWAQVSSGTLQFTHQSAGVKVPFNFIRNRKKKIKGRLTAFSPVFRAQPDTTDPADIDQAEVVDKLISAIDQKIGQDSKTGEIIDWLLDGGMCVEHTPWVPNATVEPMPVRLEDRPDIAALYPTADPRELLFSDNNNPERDPIPSSVKDAEIQLTGAPPESFEVVEELREEGDPGSEIHGPLTFFVDASVTDIHKLSPDQSVQFAGVKDKSWIAENFDDKEIEKLNGGRGIDTLDAEDNIQIIKTNLSRAGSSLGGVNLSQLLPAIQGSKGANDPDMFVVITRYQDRSKKNPDGRMTVFVPDQLILKDGPNPYDDGIPATVYNYETVTTTIFTTGWVTDLIPVNMTFDRVASDIIDYMRKLGKSPILGGPGMTEEDWGKGDQTRFIPNGLNENGTPKFAQAEVAQMPAMMPQLVELLQRTMDDLAGGTDLFQERKFPGQLRGSNAVAWLQEILDTQYGPLFSHLAERMAQAKQKRINRWKQFAPAVRTLHYVSRDDRVEVFKFHNEDILRSGTEYNITIERGSLVPELRAMREARIAERLNGPMSIMYIDERTGMFDKGKIAADLQMGDASRETREAKPRKLARDIIERLRKGMNAPMPRMFMDPIPMMDEFEDVMNDMDFLEASQQVQQNIEAYYQMLMQMAQQRAQQQQQAIMGQNEQAALAQGVQQAVARSSAEAFDISKDAIQTSLQEFVQTMFSDPEFVRQVAFSAGQSMAQAPQ